MVIDELADKIEGAIRDVADFPKPGIVFKDIAPILQNPELSRAIVGSLKQNLLGKTDAVLGIESRGFLFGFALAMELNVPFILVRKKGKLPFKTIVYKYDLEYGSAEIEMHVDAVTEGMRVHIHDDLLATGGTAEAAAKLVQMQGGKIAGFSFVVSLDFLNGKDKLKTYSDSILSLKEYK